MLERLPSPRGETKLTAALLSVGAVAGALAWGGQYGPQSPRTGAWYARLRKPSYTPPGPVFGVAWPILGGLLGFTGYRLRRRPPSPARTAALAFWWASVAGVGGYSYEFFGRKQLGASTAVTTATAAASVGLVASAWQADRPAALASLPFVGWLGFASLLSEEVWRRNER